VLGRSLPFEIRLPISEQPGLTEADFI
jgi:hypothetical protein